ncbi:hybrid sensor histidine kinase/response regulator [Rhodoferax koreense]|uniref:histidine kinase n=1 Tax=Rhodoferax koreensis TaxID=1842727 RepID=A0A1P8K4L8_9BURK|nr:hybrid sensor histidine kinase/response regulator [Rhodoferax koreense]
MAPLTAPPVPAAPPGPEATTCLYVDDEPQACKWFARMFANEFRILTAQGVDEALVLLREHPNEIAVLLTDYRMPQRSGMELLGIVQRDFRHLVRLLVTAYAEKEVAIAAINEGQVFRILEKPLDEQRTREALREALSLHALRATERAVHEQRVAAMRETLGFLAHELNTPLATVRGYMEALRHRHQPPAPDTAAGTVHFTEGTPGEVLAAIESAERRALYCQSLVATFVQSARDAYPGASVQRVTASSLVEALLDEYPFEDDEASWVSCRLGNDFVLPGRRDLLYLVLCTLTKNALYALRGQPRPSLRIELGRADGAGADGAAAMGRPWIRLADNGPGIAPEILSRLTLEPVTTKAGLAGDAHDGHGGNGMGLIFCRRVVQSIGGSIEIVSHAGQGAAVTLYFQPSNIANPGGNRV